MSGYQALIDNRTCQGFDTEIRFKSAVDRGAFTQELTQTVTTLVARYHDATTPGGRAHRLVIVAHPRGSCPPRSKSAKMAFP